jgi:hypothetical protein
MPTVSDVPFYSMSALQAIKRFRLYELHGLQAHVERYGPSAKPSIESSHKTTSPNTRALALPNPFLPHLNPKTGWWAPAQYSLRRQAELIKKVKMSNTLALSEMLSKWNEWSAVAIKMTHGFNYTILASIATGYYKALFGRDYELDYSQIIIQIIHIYQIYAKSRLTLGCIHILLNQTRHNVHFIDGCSLHTKVSK